MSSPLSTNTETTLTSVNPDIIRNHILTRLDGPALAALTCTSTHFSSALTDDDLWKAVTTATWPSTGDTRVRNAVSSFPSGHRSFFSDSFPLLHAPTATATTSAATSTSAELIFAVDLYYKNEAIFSKVRVTETESDRFRQSPFRVDIVDENHPVPTRIESPADEWWSHLVENLTLSWIVIDPARNKAANLSTRDPVSMQTVNRDLQVRYSTVVGRSSVCVVVNIGDGELWGGDRMHVAEVSMHVEDMEERRLSGEESLSVILAAMDGGKRKKWEKGQGRQCSRSTRRLEERESGRRSGERKPWIWYALPSAFLFWLLTQFTQYLVVEFDPKSFFGQ